MNVQEEFNNWLNNINFDLSTREELYAIRNDKKEIEDRFYRRLEFGTGGLRGVLGAGTNRMNRYTVREVSQGLANYISNQGNANKGIVISYDSRRMSDTFAMEAARVFAQNNVKVYMFKTLSPVPELSFAVRYLKAAAGVMITASHNPKEYNGYKIYGEDGGQMPVDWTDQVQKYMDQIPNVAEIKLLDIEEAKQRDLLEWIGENIDNEYISKLKTVSVNPQVVNEVGDQMKIIYTPLHGSGNKLVRRILKEIGFNNVLVVKEQELPNGDFPTVRVPNPEEKDSFDLAIKLAKTENADLIIGTDPDCDRLGVIVKDSNSDYVALSGNQIGCLLMDYVLSQKKSAGTLPSNGFVVTTVVSSQLATDIAKYYGVEMVEVLTGFKFIGEKIKQLDEFGDKKFLFGFEESYGYLAGTFVRDKDAVVSSMLVAEMAAFYRTQGLSLHDALDALWTKLRYTSEEVKSFMLTGKDGMDKIKSCMNELRRTKHTKIGELEVLAVRDYLLKKREDMKTGEITPITLPKSDVLYFELEQDQWFCIRPSGTEPKIKTYYGVYSKDKSIICNLDKKIKQGIQELIEPLIFTEVR